MPTAEPGGAGRVRLFRFAGLGGVTGAIAAAFWIAVGFHWLTLYVVPGLAFGLVFGALLHRQRLLRAGRAALYIIAATVANAGAVLIALRSFNAVEAMVGSQLALMVSGAIAGAAGGAILAAAAVPPLRTVQALWLAVVGALLGALLPMLMEGREIGTVAFYMIWHAGYATALAALLPRTEI